MKSLLDRSWVLIAVIGAFVGGLIIAKGQFFVCADWSLGWEMLSAIGTFTAAAVAVWIAGQRDRRLEEAAREKALVIAARIYNPLMLYNREIRVSRDWFKNADPNNLLGGLPNQQRILKEILNRRAVTDIEIEGLIGLENKAALRVSSAHGHLETASRMIDQNMKYFDANLGVEVVGRVETLSAVAHHLSSAVEQLNMAIFAFQAASIISGYRKP